jgi:hypothetical protein
MSIASRAAAAVRAPAVLSRARRRLKTPQYDALMRRKHGKSKDNVWRLRCYKLAREIVVLMDDQAVTADESRPYLEIIAQHNPNPKKSASQWLAKLAADYDIACPASLLDQIGDAADFRPRDYTPDYIGHALEVTFEDRERLELWQIGCCDVSAKERKALMAERKRQKDRKRNARKRRDKGAQSRAEYLASNSASRTEPWKALGMSRPKYYRLGLQKAA